MASVPTIASALSRIYYSAGGSALPWSNFFAYRPSQWIIAAALSMTTTDDQTGVKTAYVFDGILRAEHDQQTVITLNPVQTGAPLSDHAYTAPPRLVVEIAMSDAMQSYTFGQWADAPSKSVSAYQTLVSIQQQRRPVSVATRLRQYDNMIITEMRAEESRETRYGLKAQVTFTRILTASVEATSSTVSFVDPDLGQTVGSSVIGQTQTVPVPDSVQAQNNIARALEAGISLSFLPRITASGKWSSVQVGALATVSAIANRL